MSLNPFPTVREGDYILLRGEDTEEQREDAQKVLSNNGCKTFRFEQLEDGRLRIHGYLGIH